MRKVFWVALAAALFLAGSLALADEPDEAKKEAAPAKTPVPTIAAPAIPDPIPTGAPGSPGGVPPVVQPDPIAGAIPTLPLDAAIPMCIPAMLARPPEAEVEARKVAAHQAKTEAKQAEVARVDGQLMQVVNVIKKMKPKAAAEVANEWPSSFAVDVFARLSARVAAPILAQMPTRRAAALTQLMATKGNARAAFSLVKKERP
ncbi:MAG: hypothetical protein ACI9MR_003991 [Myxococcota bacterium]|jgi:hypothetical protein